MLLKRAINTAKKPLTDLTETQAQNRVKTWNKLIENSRFICRTVTRDEKRRRN